MSKLGERISKQVGHGHSPTRPFKRNLNPKESEVMSKHFKSYSGVVDKEGKIYVSNHIYDHQNSFITEQDLKCIIELSLSGGTV